MDHSKQQNGNTTTEVAAAAAGDRKGGDVNPLINKFRIDNKISDFDISMISKPDDSSQFSGSQYQYKDSLDFHRDDDQFHKQDEVNENPRTVKFISGLKEGKVDNKLSSLYCIDKDMIQMPIINLPSSNKYGLEENIHFVKDSQHIDQQKVWMNLTKDVLNPFVSNLRPLVSKQTDLDSVLDQDQQLKFKAIHFKNGAVDKLLNPKTMNLVQALPNQKKSEYRASNSLDHFFQYIIKESQNNNNINTNKTGKSNLHPNGGGFQNHVSKFQAQAAESSMRAKKPSQSQLTNSQKKLIKNTSPSTNAPPKQLNLNVTPFISLAEEDSSENRQKQLLKVITSPRNGAATVSSPTNIDGIQSRIKRIQQQTAALQAQNAPQQAQQQQQQQQQQRQQDTDVFDILDRKYRKKYNMEYKMQLRRKSCCCTRCGSNTNYENKYQNIVNPILVRKRKRFTKVFKVVNFLNIMSRTTKQQLPSNVDVDNESQASINNGSIQDASETNMGSQKNISLAIPGNPRKSIKMDPPSLTKIGLNNIVEESPVRRKEKLLTMKITSKREDVRKGGFKIRKSFTLHVDDDVQRIIPERTNADSSDCSPSHQHDSDDDNDSQSQIDRRQQSFAMEINSDHDVSISKKRHQVADKRSKHKKLSYIQQKSSFLSFIEQKIQEAKKKREEEEIKYVGKTPLTLLLQILSQGKRNSVFNATQQQEKKLAQFLEQRQRQNVSLHKERQNYENYSHHINTDFYYTDKAGGMERVANQNNFSSIQLHKTSNGQEDSLSANTDDVNQFYSARKNITTPSQNTAASAAISIPPLALFKKKINRKEIGTGQRERGFVISPVNTKTFDQMTTYQIGRSSNGFNSARKQNADTHLNPLKIVKKQIKESKERDPYMQQNGSQMQPEVHKITNMKAKMIREKKLNQDSSQPNNHYFYNMQSYSTLRNTNTAQTTDRSSVLSNSNRKMRSDVVRGEIPIIKNRPQNSNSKSTLNKTESQNSFRQQHVMTANQNNSSFSQSNVMPLSVKNTNPQTANNINKAMISPRLQHLLSHPSLKNKSNPYLQQMFQSQMISSKSPEQFAVNTNNQGLSHSQSQKFFKSAKSHRQ